MVAPNYSRLESLNPFISFNRSIPRVHDLYPDHVFLVYFSNFKKKFCCYKKNVAKIFFFRFLEKGKFDQNCYNCKNFCYNFFDPKFVAIFFIVATNFMVVAIFVRVVALLGGATLEGC